MSNARAALPLEPLWEIARNRSGDPDFSTDKFAAEIGTTGRAVTRWRSKGGMVPWIAADEAATALGLHPANVWGIEVWCNVKGDFEKLAAEALAEIEEDELVDALATEAASYEADYGNAYDDEDPELLIAMMREVG